MRGTALAALAVLAGAAAAAAVATPAAASAPQNALSGVWCASPASCIAVGVSGPNAANPVSGQPLAETWNGKSWTAVRVRLPAGAATGGLTGLSCVSSTSCVAVGYYGKGYTGYELAESWNGRAWTPGEPPAPAGQQTSLAGVSCPSARSCVAVGAYENAKLGLPVAVIEEWNGAKWTEVKPPLPAAAISYSNLNSVSCPSPAYCVAVGGSFTADRGTVLVESWHGKAWQRVSAPSPAAGAQSVLTGVSCASAASCVAVGLNISANFADVTGFAEPWNGRAWTVTKVPWPKGTASDSQLLGVSCPAASSCVAVGNTGQNTNTPDNSGKAAAATWNGKTWAVQPVPAPAKGTASVLQGVSCPAAGSCAAVGKAGPVGSVDGTGLSGFWNGRSWRLVTAI